MVANPIARETAALPLLLEPDEPAEGERAMHGWRREHDGQPIRDHADDPFGAEVQWAIARNVLLGTPRKVLARGLGVSERGAQGYLSGDNWRAYARPVLRALQRLGIGSGRGRWHEDSLRPREILAASRPLMARAADVLAGAPIAVEERDQLVADLRLLGSVTDGRSGGR